MAAFHQLRRGKENSMRKVLVLEDEANIRGFIVINLRRAGYDVIEAESGGNRRL